MDSRSWDGQPEPSSWGWREVNPPLVLLDQAPTGTFQANRALNGEQDVAARQHAHVQCGALDARAVPRGPSHVSSPCGWDQDVFPMEHDLFGDDLADLDSANTFQHNLGGGDSAALGASHSACFSCDFGLEGGGAC
ncbi:hypothetical protein F5880DRAFT_1618977 [Lentinula raphanica]|nr:hypothetical protein F5880DRAFT_1618977 [Lentinula raphanica]